MPPPVFNKEAVKEPYRHQEFPRLLYKPNRDTLLVQDENEQAVALKNGWLKNPPSAPVVDEKLTPTKIDADMQRVQDELDEKIANVEELAVQLQSCHELAKCLPDHYILRKGDYGYSPAYQAILDLRKMLAEIQDDEKKVKK